MKIKKGDLVKVLSGKDRKKEGEVLHVIKDEHKVIVKGVNMLKKYRKSQDEETGRANNEKIEIEGKIHISNVQLVNPKNGKPSRVGYKIVKGKKERYFKNS